MSSLAAQLAGIRANNNATVLAKSKRKKIHSVSLIYDAKEAASQDFETIYYDCLEAFRELVGVDARFEDFAGSLFSETSIRFDRQVQAAEQNNALNAAIDRYLMLTAAYLHLQPALRALEWLVRRFQIQIHNAESLLLAVLPWHDEPVFVRFLAIVQPTQLPPIFQFLSVAQKSMQGPSKTSLLRVFSKDAQLLDQVNAWTLLAMQRGLAYNRELVFWSGVSSLLAFAYKEDGDAATATDRLLPLVSEVVALEAHPQAQVAGYLVLAVLATQFRLSRDVLEAAITAVVTHWSPESQVQGMRCVAQLVAAFYAETGTPALPAAAFDAVLGAFGSLAAVTDAVKAYSAPPLDAALVIGCLAGAPAEFAAVVELALRPGVVPLVRDAVLKFVLANAPFDDELSAAFVAFAAAAAPSAAQADRLEIALQTSLPRSEATTGEANGEANGDAGISMNGVDANGDVEMADADDASKQDLLEEAAEMEQSTRRTFLETPLPSTDRRAQLWSRLAAVGSASLEELRQAARVAPEAELSFALAIAIGPWPTLSRLAGVRVAAALVTAVLEGDAAAADYQSVLPIVLFLLADSEPRVRHEGARLLNAVSRAKPTARTPRWLLGAAQGTDGGLQWLGRHDLATVVRRLGEHVAECELDPQHVLVAARQAGKAAWCDFLVSHAATTRLPQVLWITLRCLAAFKGVARQLTAPLLSGWNTPPVHQQWVQLCREARFPLAAVERALVGVLRTNEHAAIVLLLDLLRSREDEAADTVAQHIAELWAAPDTLKTDTKLYIAEALVEMAVDEAVRFDPTALLGQLELDTPMFVRLLEESPSAILPHHGHGHHSHGHNGDANGSTNGAAHGESEPPLFNEASKRRRRRSSSSLQLRPGPVHEVAAAAERHLRRTTLVLELLEPRAPQLGHTAPLIALLFDTLERLMALGEGAARLPVLYTEELLANCMIELVAALKRGEPQAARELSALKVSVVVACIRTSTSPQVQNRLLLLVASLATLCPDAVLHGVMPIFTFMGANTVRLDNDFSAHVIQQTIEQVIPALIAAGDRHEEIEMALMSFVAAFPHVPRHRRNTLFGALIKTLGPAQSLYKLLLLLAQRYAEALLAPTRRFADAKSLVHFATPFLRSFAPAEQLRAMNSFVRFVATSEVEGAGAAKFGLLKISQNFADAAQPDALRNLFYEFLVRTAGEPETIAGTQPLRVQVAAAAAQQQFGDDDWLLATAMVEQLLRQDTLPAAETLLVKVLGVLPIDRFVQVVMPLIAPENAKVLDLVVEKFRWEASDDDVALAAAEFVAAQLLELMSVGRTTPALIDTAEAVFGKFGSRLREEGLSFLSLLIGPNGLQNRDDDEIVVSACLGINSVTQNLGAATYKYFPQFFPALQHRMKTTSNSDVELAGFALMAGLVRHMPRFMEAETPGMVELVLASHIAVAPRMQLLRVLNDKISARTLLKALTHAWTAAFAGGLAGVDMLFVALGNVEEKITARELAGEVSAATDLLIQCLSVREQLSAQQAPPDYNFINQVESRAIEWGVGTVLKLNDRVFRPQFKRLVEWGLGTPSSLPPARHVAVLKFVNRVLGQLKGIVTNYYGYIFDDVSRLLEDQGTDATVKKLVLQSLVATVSNDQDDFWQAPARYDRLVELLVTQLRTQPITHGSLLVKAVVALALNSSPQNRKRLNDELSQLLVAGAAPSQKIWTVKVFSGLYRRLGEDWVANLPQLVPLIAELLDDDNEAVENETRKSLVPVIENVLGESLDRYLA